MMTWSSTEMDDMDTAIVYWENDTLPMGPDETEFDTHDEKELAELWWEFCKENNLIGVDFYKDDKLVKQINGVQ